MGNKKGDNQVPQKGPAEKKLELDGLKEAFEGEPSGMEGELGRKYEVDNSDEGVDNKQADQKIKHPQKDGDKPKYKGPSDNE